MVTPDLAERLQNRPEVMAALTVLTLVAIVASAVAVGWVWVRRPCVRELLQRPWSGGDASRLVALLAVLWLTLWIVVYVLHRTAAVNLENASTRMGVLVVQTLTLHWPVLGFVAVVLWRRKRSLREAFGMTLWPGLRTIALALFLYLATLPPAGMASWVSRRLLGPWMEFEPQPVLEILMEAEPGLGRGYLWFLAVALAPVSEEILFRGILLPVLSRRIGLDSAVLITAAVFALVHAHAASASVLFVLGISFGLAYLYTHTLWVPILMHAVFNSVSLLLVTYLSS